MGFTSSDSTNAFQKQYFLIHNHKFPTVDSQPWIKNTVFDLQLVESVDAKDNCS